MCRRDTPVNDPAAVSLQNPPLTSKTYFLGGDKIRRESAGELWKMQTSCLHQNGGTDGRKKMRDSIKEVKLPFLQHPSMPASRCCAAALTWLPASAWAAEPFLILAPLSPGTESSLSYQHNVIRRSFSAAAALHYTTQRRRRQHFYHSGQKLPKQDVAGEKKKDKKGCDLKWSPSFNPAKLSHNFPFQQRR